MAYNKNAQFPSLNSVLFEEYPKFGNTGFVGFRELFLTLLNNPILPKQKMRPECEGVLIALNMSKSILLWKQVTWADRPIVENDRLAFPFLINAIAANQNTVALKLQSKLVWAKSKSNFLNIGTRRKNRETKKKIAKFLKFNFLKRRPPNFESIISSNFTSMIDLFLNKTDITEIFYKLDQKTIMRQIPTQNFELSIRQDHSILNSTQDIGQHAQP